MKSMLALVVALTAGHAWACTCAIGGPVFPRDGATNVPTNVVIHALYNAPPDPSRATLRRADDQQPVTVEFSSGPAPAFFAFTPVARLESNTDYTFTLAERAFSFRTGEGEDTSPPTKPSFAGATFEYTPPSGTCGDAKRWVLDITGGDDDWSARDDLIVLVHDTSPIGATQLSEPRLSASLCRTNFAPPDGSPVSLSVQVMDLAGNVSELSSTQSVRTCSVAPGGVFALLALMVARRGRRS
ncbi:MAG: Ig-like domain-containing protein [Archangium sp.]